MLLRDYKEFFNIENPSQEEIYYFVRSLVAEVKGVQRNPHRFYPKSKLPKSYVSIDIETTGISKTDEIIQIGAVKFVQGKEVEHFSTFIKPKEKELTTQIAYLTGIRPEYLESAPFIEEIKSELLAFIEDYSVIGHNIATFDLPFLRRSDIDLTENFSVDTLTYARSLNLEVENHKLTTLKSAFGIVTKSHDALEDARATALLYEKLRKGKLPDSSLSQLEVTTELFANTQFAYTGMFHRYSREEVQRLVETNGGKCLKSVSRNTDYLVVGVQVANNLKGGTSSSSELKALELQEKGHKIKIISEDEFPKMLGGSV